MIRTIALIIGSIATISFMSCGNTDSNTDTKNENKDTTKTVENSPKGYEINQQVKDFTLKNVDGTDLNLKTYLADKKGAIIIFTCNHCPYSVKYEDRIIALDKKYKELGYPVIAINPNDPAEQKEDSYELMQKRAQEKGFTFPYLFDDGQKVYPQFGAMRTPHVFVVQNLNATIIVKYIGAIDDNSDDITQVKEKFVENAVDALLNNQPVPVEKTKAIGCTIKDKRNKK